jgi:hypothetical protein
MALEKPRNPVRSASGDITDAKPHFELAARPWHEVGAPYETALARRTLADALRAEGNQRAARVESVQAIPQTSPPGLNAFRREGDYWSVAFDGRMVRLRDLKGMHCLARLLADAGREFHVMDLVALESGGHAPVGVSEPLPRRGPGWSRSKSRI